MFIIIQLVIVVKDCSLSIKLKYDLVTFIYIFEAEEVTNQYVHYSSRSVALQKQSGLEEKVISGLASSYDFWLLAVLLQFQDLVELLVNGRYQLFHMRQPGHLFPPR